MSERRHHRRKEVDARVELHHPDLGTIKAHTRDISNGGMFVVLQQCKGFPVGARVRLRLVDSAAPGIMFNAKVVHRTGEGIGLMFLNYEQDGARFALTELRRVWRPKEGARASP